MFSANISYLKRKILSLLRFFTNFGMLQVYNQKIALPRNSTTEMRDRGDVRTSAEEESQFPQLRGVDTE